MVATEGINISPEKAKTWIHSERTRAADLVRYGEVELTQTNDNIRLFHLQPDGNFSQSRGQKDHRTDTGYVINAACYA